ncbi:MAG: Holliday junction resolvase RuvX [Acidobacteria bacterium]|nr:Holliday junction resolvase RuvX [Acidobacteriota bacterium]
MPGRILAVDFGTKRIGLAVSDALGITAQGLPTRERTRIEDDLRHIQELAAEHSVELVLVGNPVSKRGDATPMAKLAAAFAQKLARRIASPVQLWDERLTTAEAMRVLRDSGIGLDKRRQARDRVAATLLLQSYLDFHANERARNSSAGQVQP